MEKHSADRIKQAVREQYGSLARSVANTEEVSCCGPTLCCEPPTGSHETASLAARLYGEGELNALPETVTAASAGCGNPTAISELNPGETVLDLGSGGGIDCFLAREKVGPEGQVIGLDMTPAMIALARKNARKLGYSNVEFRQGDMEDMPLEDGSVDVIISNCVINLSPDKDAVFREAFRVLRPGGRLNVSDMVLTGPLPKEVRGSMEQWVGCIAGALVKEDYLQRIEAAGFSSPDVVEEMAYPQEGTDKVLSITLSVVKA